MPGLLALLGVIIVQGDGIGVVDHNAFDGGALILEKLDRPQRRFSGCGSIPDHKQNRVHGLSKEQRVADGLHGSRVKNETVVALARTLEGLAHAFACEEFGGIGPKVARW